MPIVRAGHQLVYYAHVPKCGGSAVAWYLRERFGAPAFQDERHTSQNPETCWSRTSPQHIDRRSLAHLFPEGFFDAVFTIVRHPVARMVSAYHFQRDVERSIPEQIGFSEWLVDVEEHLAENAFAFDNHVRPMTDIVPEGARIFHMEHGLDGLIAWFDDLTGQASGPRAVPRFNEQGQHTGDSTRTEPTATDIARIADIHAVDFKRFGYDPDHSRPFATPPELTPEQIRDRDAFLRTFNKPLQKVRRKIGNALGR